MILIIVRPERDDSNFRRFNVWQCQAAVLVAIVIPIFNTQLEKARESTDISNARDYYAEISVVLVDGTLSASSMTIFFDQRSLSIITLSMINRIPKRSTEILRPSNPFYLCVIISSILWMTISLSGILFM